MKQNIRTHSRGKTVAFISFSLAILICLSFTFTYAEFTNSSRAKRVVATYDSVGVLFSSNYLSSNVTLGNASPDVYRRMIYTDGSTHAYGEITVCNYAQGNTAKTYEYDITYELYAALVILGESNGKTTKTPATAAQVGEKSVSLQYKNTTVVLNSSTLSNTFAVSTLDHRNASTDICKVTFSEDFNGEGTGNLALYLCARPVGNSSGITPLDSVFTTGTNSIRNAWSGRFSDVQTNHTPSDYDGLNYVISGSGVGTVVLSWKDDTFKVNNTFIKSVLDEAGASAAYTSGVNGWSTLEFPVDSSITDRYDLQFYFADENVARDLSWTDLNNNDIAEGTYVRFSYTES